MTSTAGTCQQSNCNVAQDGRCLEGLSLDATSGSPCPYFRRDADALAPDETDAVTTLRDDDADDYELTPTTSIAPRYRTLSSGEELPLSEAAEVLRAHLAKFIILAGDSDGGKSTLLATLHEKFGRGPFGGWAFAGSRTLPALERISYDSRVSSGRSEPDTLHTSPSLTSDFLHWRVCREPELDSEELPRLREVLISNVSGETFERIRDSAEEAASHDYMRRADHFALVLDGAKLISLRERHSAVNSARQILRRLMEAKHIAERTVVQIIFSKWDWIEEPKGEGCASAPECREFVRKVQDQFYQQCSEDVGALHFREVCARPRPDNKKTEDALGLDELLESWVNESLLLRPVARRVVVKGTSRESARFVWPPHALTV